MFNKSFSNEAVEIAVKYIRLFDDNPDALFDLHEPQKCPSPGFLAPSAA